MKKADHFHCTYALPSGELEEIEGGFTGLPENWDELSLGEKKEWTRDQAIAWGMPDDAEVKNFYLAG